MNSELIQKFATQRVHAQPVKPQRPHSLFMQNSDCGRMNSAIIQNRPPRRIPRIRRNPQRGQPAKICPENAARGDYIENNFEICLDEANLPILGGG